MITRNQVDDWARLGESETIELKATTSQRSAASQTLCAMLNHRGGRVLFGVTPDRKVVGQQLSDKSTEDVAQASSELDPPAFPTIDLYPLLALREALANAFCHRDYSIGGGSVAVAVYDDRLEVTSSGTLHFGLTAEALFQPHESLPWNPLIARVLYRRGIIESWGRGTLKMAELTAQAGLPRPDIEDAGGCVTVRFSPARYQPPRRVQRDLSERQRVILAELSTRPRGLALRELRADLPSGVAEWEVKGDLALLKHLGLVDNAGYGRGAYWFLVPAKLAEAPELE